MLIAFIFEQVPDTCVMGDDNEQTTADTVATAQTTAGTAAVADTVACTDDTDTQVPM